MRFLEFFAANIRTRAGHMPARLRNSWPLVGIPAEPDVRLDV
jgi:hypothetical protein